MGILDPEKADCWMRWKERAKTAVKEEEAKVGAKAAVRTREVGVGAATLVGIVVQDPGTCPEVGQDPDRVVVLVSFLVARPGLVPVQNRQMPWMSDRFENPLSGMYNLELLLFVERL